MQHDRNTTDSAREKYLSLNYPLTSGEQAIINRDLNSPEFRAFQNEKGNGVILPEKYSADTTYLKIEKHIHKRETGSKVRFLRKYQAIAASILLLLGVGCYFLYNMQNSAPQQLLVSTGYGETREVLLPDSSIVVLNSLSYLSYPEQFGRSERKVRLEGEGYFKIKKDRKKPFSVEAGAICIKVLGTTFNVQSYANEQTIETALLEGSIAIHYKGQIQKLIPGETAVYDKRTASLRIEKNDLSSITRWQQKTLVFEDCPLEEILRTLERKENIQFEIRDPDLKTFRITARFIHQESVYDILDVLGRSAGFTYKKQGKKSVVLIPN